ncbi:MAG: hypothetical protein IPM39_15155 [Chloroflexi bacterium]|nr:hypothetical protein [Chloroflexota bacterium]
MTERAFGQLSGVGDVTARMWPSYKRVTAAQGGDVSAEFQFADHDALLEQWFYDYLGREFREHYNGQTAFLGRIHTMRLAYNRLVLTVSLDWLFNSVACAYTSALDGSTLYSDFTEDSGSIARWGKRQHIIRPSDVTIGLDEAEEVAADFLADFARPRISRGEVQRKLERGSLQVAVQGYSQTLDAELYREESEGEDDASDEIKLALVGATFISQGRIEGNARQVSIQADWQSKLKRLEWIAGRRDAQGRRYTFGCVGSKLFDYQPVVGTARYRIWVKRPTVAHYDADENYVPAPLVRPGGYSEIADLSAPAGDVGNEWSPRRQWDASVVYDQNGAMLRGGAWGVQERAAAIQMSIAARAR